jgi:hypothetical protein
MTVVSTKRLPVHLRLGLVPSKTMTAELLTGSLRLDNKKHCQLDGNTVRGHEGALLVSGARRGLLAKAGCSRKQGRCTRPAADVPCSTCFLRQSLLSCFSLMMRVHIESEEATAGRHDDARPSGAEELFTCAPRELRRLRPARDSFRTMDLLLGRSLSSSASIIAGRTFEKRSERARESVVLRRRRR